MKTTDKSRRQPRRQAMRNLRAEIRRISGEQVEAPSLPSGTIAAMIEAVRGGTTRRDILKSGMVTAGALALPGGALAVGLGSAKKPGPTGTSRTEPRSFVFDLSWADTSNHDVVLAAHPRRYRLRRISPAKRRTLRAKHPVLELVSDARMTHYLDVDMPAESIQWCYIQRFERGRKNGQDPGGGKDRGTKDGRWAMLGTFVHHPTRALLAAAEKEHALLGAGEHPKVPDKWKRHGLTGEQLLALADPVGLDALKDSNDTAATMVAGHPEVLCLDDTNSAYIHNTIVSQNTDDLAGLIEFQGPAEPQANWVDCSTPFQANPSGYATLVPICNPDTDEPRRDSQTGEIQYMPEYSDTTNSSLNSDALQPSLAAVKQDTTLGSNNGSNPDSTQGVIWRSEDGVTTSAQTETSLGLGAALSYTARDFSPGHGYSVKITDVDDDPSDPTVEALISIEVKNWFVRFLGLYVRYLDSDGQIIPPDKVACELGESVMDKYFDFHDCCEFFDTSTEVFLQLLFPEFEIFGMPVSETSKKLTIPMPSSATSILILASGMGSTSNASNPYSESIATGTTMTGTVSLGITFFFLTLAAAAAASPFVEALQDPENTRKLLPLFIELFVDLFENDLFHNPSAFKGVGVKVGALLMGNAAKPILTFLAPYIVEAENEQAVLDAIPFIGAGYSAFVAVGTLAQMAQTAIEVAISPSTYAYEVTLTHDIEVTVRPNLSPPPDGDPNGWPATATHFDVIAHFDGGTPTSVRVALPPTQTTDPQIATFRNVPLGGQVAMSVGVYSDTNFLVGSASAGPVANDETVSFDITFKELLVPLDASTVYSHKELIALTAAGQHVWQASTTPPFQAPRGCSPSNGQLCSLDGITVNSASGDVGQSFQSYNNAVPTCGNPSSFSNGHQFSNISSGQNPESAFFFTGCTFPSSPKLVYDLLNRNHANFYLDTSSRGPNYQGVIRQVRLSDEPNPGFDAPDSNLAWGKLQHPSDSLLLHPAGKIISVANTKNKFEVIDLPDAARSDADAPFSNTYSAQGLRPGLMDGPVLAALDPDGTILVIEGGNRRIQAFDLNGNAAPIFPGGAYFVPLKDQPVSQYLDFAIEFKGYMYVLSIVSGVFTLDIYQPDGTWLSATRGFEAQRLAVNYWRDVYAQNAQVLTLPNGAIPARTEPSISHWIPSTP
jgi:hypothetical protein